MTDSRLLVDIGNSRLKWNIARANGNGFEQPTTAVEYKDRSLADLLDSQWGVITTPFPSVAVVNVAGDTVAGQVTDWCINRWGIKPRFFTITERFQSIINGYKDPAQLGADRWMAVIAAHRREPRCNNLVIDCGTAITVDTVMADGRHHGGPIIPGPDMMLRSLVAETADLQRDYGADSSASVFVDNTVAAVASGINFAAGSALDVIIARIREKLYRDSDDNNMMKIWVTGGAGSKVMSQTGITDYTLEPDLVLQGLYIVAAEHNLPG